MLTILGEALNEFDLDIPEITIEKTSYEASLAAPVSTRVEPVESEEPAVVPALVVIDAPAKVDSDEPMAAAPLSVEAAIGVQPASVVVSDAVGPLLVDVLPLVTDAEGPLSVEVVVREAHVENEDEEVDVITEDDAPTALAPAILIAASVPIPHAISTSPTLTLAATVVGSSVGESTI